MSQEVCLVIDLSRWQWGRPVPWKALREKGVVGCINKSTQARYIDPFFKRAMQEARDEGMVPGTYTWFDPKHPPEAMADFFCNTVKDFDDLIVCGDFEEVKTPILGQRLVDAYEEFGRRIESNTKKLLKTYSGTWYYRGYAHDVDSEWMAQRGYWHSQYPRLGVVGVDYQAAIIALAKLTPELPKPWRSRNLREFMWQFDGDGGLTLPNGVDADFNIFHGDLDDLVAVSVEKIIPYTPQILDYRTFGDPLNTLDVVRGLSDDAAAEESLDLILARKSPEAVREIMREVAASIMTDTKFLSLLSSSTHRSA